MRSAAVLIVSVVGAAASAPPAGVPPTRLTVPAGSTLGAAAVAVERAAGLRLDLGPLDPNAGCPPLPADAPLWTIVHTVAERTGTHPVVAREGRQVTFAKPGGPAPAASVDGAFRVAARGVNVRADYDAGRAGYEVLLDLHWEPRFPVLRVTAQPTITTATDDRGNRLTVPDGGAKSPVAGYAHAPAVRVDGLTRAASRIGVLAGYFTVTAAPRMLAFRFDDLGKVPATLEQDGVRVTLTGFDRRDDRWDVGLRLEYPEGHPAFESFESWTARNAIKLIPPDRSRSIGETSFDVIESGRTASATYRFPAAADRRGWAVVYETPAPLAEFPVRFELRELPLP